jgi:hypothetical protein
MATRAITATINRSGFEATESFMSKSDAQAWREMVETTLDHRENICFDLVEYARGLAETVRTHGGGYTRDKWLNVEVPQEEWVKGLSVKLDHGATNGSREQALEIQVVHSDRLSEHGEVDRQE